jgi:hypothetical protein
LINRRHALGPGEYSQDVTNRRGFDLTVETRDSRLKGAKGHNRNQSRNGDVNELRLERSNMFQHVTVTTVLSGTVSLGLKGLGHYDVIAAPNVASDVWLS